MTKVHVIPGVCGFETDITVQSPDGQNASVDIETQCPNLKPLENELKEVYGFAACLGTMSDSPVYRTAHQYCRHPACPVPCAIIKGIEVACGLALPKDVSITITKE